MPETPPIQLTDILRRSDQQVSCELDGEAVLLSIHNGHYYHFNAVASRVWELLEEPRTVAEVRDVLLDEYDVAPGQCERELLGVLGEMHEGALIETA